MKALKIVILLKVPDECQVTLLTGETTLPTTPPAPAPAAGAGSGADQAAGGGAGHVAGSGGALEDVAPSAPPPGRNPKAEALAALIALGVHHPDKTLKMYAPERIIQVCRNAANKTNPPAWATQALHKGWTMPQHHSNGGP